MSRIIKGASLLFVLSLFCLGLDTLPVSVAEDVFRVTKEKRITADIASFPLEQALAALAHQVPLEIRGSVAEDETVTLHFSQLTLQEVLQRLMDGYNYVLVQPEDEGKLVLAVIGKAERVTKKADEGVPTSPATLVSSPTATASLMLPPTSAGQAQYGQIPGTEQGNLPPGSYAPGAPGIATNPDSQPPFNPAAWGGRGRRGSPAPARK